MSERERGLSSAEHRWRERGARAMKLLINGRVDMKYRTLTYRVSVMYS